MEMQAKLLNLKSFTEDGKMIVSFAIDKRLWDELSKYIDKDINVKIGLLKKLRSKDANAYAWALIDKLAQKMKQGKKEVYRHYVKNVPGTSVTVMVKKCDADRISRDWERNGLGWQAQSIWTPVDGYTNLILSEGSSVFDSSQMTDLIRLIQDDCKEQGIPTETPEETERLISLWRPEYE